MVVMPIGGGGAGTPLQCGRFRRTIEDFVCDNCGAGVRGDGYTDHCPRCLYGKHVDVMPGDRSADCKGIMRPIGASYAGGNSVIYYRCDGCGSLRRFKAASGDDARVIADLIALRRSGTV